MTIKIIFFSVFMCACFSVKGLNNTYVNDALQALKENSLESLQNTFNQCSQNCKNIKKYEENFWSQNLENLSDDALDKELQKRSELTRDILSPGALLIYNKTINILFYAFKNRCSQKILEYIITQYETYFSSDGGINKVSFYEDEQVTPLIMSIIACNLLALHILLQKSSLHVNKVVSGKYKNALYCALQTYEGDPAYIELLLKAKANPLQAICKKTYKTVCDVAISKNLVVIFDLLLKKNESNTTLCEWGSPLVTALLYLLGTKDEKQRDYYHNLISYCLENKYFINTYNCQKYTPLHMAYYLDDVNLFERILQAGADINAKTCEKYGGNTLLHLFAENKEQKKNCTAMIKILVKDDKKTLLLRKNAAGKYPDELTSDEEIKDLLNNLQKE